MANSPIGVDTSPGTWLADDMHSTWTAGSPKVTGENFEFQAVTSSGVPSQWCLGNAGYFMGAQSDLLPCGANGTVWVVVKSGNGYCLYGRYWLNQGFNEVLAAYDWDLARPSKSPTSPA